MSLPSRTDLCKTTFPKFLLFLDEQLWTRQWPMEGDLIGTLPSVAHYPVNGKGGGRGERRRRGEKGDRRNALELLLLPSCRTYATDTHLQVCVYPGTKQISECTILYQPGGENDSWWRGETNKAGISCTHFAQLSRGRTSTPSLTSRSGTVPSWVT